jgi:SAM-dependent methyltransferase
VKKSSSWEAAYQSLESLWGFKPDPILVEYASLVPKGRILDLGIGEGRNAFFFAKLGYEVDGFDISLTAVERCLARAKNEKLKIKAEVTDLKEIKIPSNKYSLIISAWVLNFFTKKEAEEILKEIKDNLKKNGFIYIGVFAPIDPGYKEAKKNLEMIEENTFYSPRIGSFIHYFTREEILALFTDFKIIYCAEGSELDIGHGEPHYHGFIVYMGQKSE